MSDLSLEIEDDLLKALRQSAAAHGRTIEDEARHILSEGARLTADELAPDAAEAFATIRQEAGGGANLALPRRSFDDARPLDLPA